MFKKYWILVVVKSANKHNETVEAQHAKYGAESPNLRDFNEGQIVYGHFPSKTIMSTHSIKENTNEVCRSLINLFKV